MRDPYPPELLSPEGEDALPRVIPETQSDTAHLTVAIHRLAAAIEKLSFPTVQPQLVALPPVQPVASDVCPVHRQPWKVVPAGITKKGPRAGQPYDAFRACPVNGCTQRP